LQKDDGEPFAERFGGAKEFGEDGTGIDENAFVRDFLGRLQGEKEIGWAFGVPALDGGNGGDVIKSGVNFESVKLRGVVRKVVARLHVLRIESFLPALGGEGGSAEAKQGPGGWGRHRGMIMPERGSSRPGRR
jgi:hypothetical protein